MTGPCPNPWVEALSPYTPGTAPSPTDAATEKLSANESVFGPSPAAMAAYRAIADRLWCYPEGDPVALRRAIAHAHGLDPARIMCGNGSDELLALITQAYAGPDAEVVHCRHGFAMYPILARAFGARSVAVANRPDLSADVDALLAAVTDKTRIVFLDNPNNPTGTYLPHQEVERLHRGLPEQVLLVLDAAYAESVDAADYDPGATLVQRHNNVVMTRTLSKLYGLAALRIGWLFGPPGVVDMLNRCRGPYNLNAAAAAAGAAAVADRDWLEDVRQQTVAARQHLAAALAALGLRVTPSQTNFVLVRLSSAEQAQAAQAHLAAHGVLVRHLPGQGLDDALRITVGNAQQMHAVETLMAAFLTDGQAA
ncbi:MAG: histidinol-phosphate transaminase [Rhodothalassiaceae bacterium]